MDVRVLKLTTGEEIVGEFIGVYNIPILFYLLLHVARCIEYS